MSAKRQMSELRPVSYGTAAEHKDLDSIWLEVLADEQDPMMEGELAANASEYNAKGTDADGKPYEIKTKTSPTKRAQWLAIGCPNRMTPPDVRRGEKVMLYQYADAPDKYYWVTCHADLNARKLETVVYGYSATNDPNAKPGEDNTYIVEISSHKKHIRISTSAANGEKFRYNAIIDTGNGSIHIGDNIGNAFDLNSTEHHLKLSNADGSFFEIIGDAFKLFTSQTGHIETKDLEIICQTLKTTAAMSSELTTAANTINAPTAHNGNIALAGNMQGSAGESGTGMSTWDGGIHIKQSLVVDCGGDIHGTLTVDKLISKQAIDAPNIH